MAANLPEKKVLIEFIEAYTVAQVSKNEKLIKYATDELLQLIENMYGDEVELSPVSLVD